MKRRRPEERKKNIIKDRDMERREIRMDQRKKEGYKNMKGHRIENERRQGMTERHFRIPFVVPLPFDVRSLSSETHP